MKLLEPNRYKIVWFDGENQHIQWDKWTDSNHDDSNYTETTNIFNFLALYVVLYYP